MTCIVGIEHKGTVWMGGDSAGTNGRMNQTIRADKKVFVIKDILIGFCGSFRVGQLLRHKLEIPTHVQGISDAKFLVGDFIDSVKKCLADGSQELPKDFEGSFLVGYRGKLYHVQADFQVGMPEAGFDACGSGADLALGAMMASKKVWSPKKRIQAALEAAALGNAAVRPPFTILQLKK